MSAQINFQDVTAPRGSQCRNIAAAMVIAGVAVVGTGGMAWSALSMALDSPLKPRLETGSMAAQAPAQTGHLAVEGFAEGTRTQASAAKPAQAPAPIVIEGPVLSTRGETSLAAAAQDGLFAPSSSSTDGETAPIVAATPETDSTTTPVPRPTSAPVVQALTTGAMPQQPATTTTAEERSRLGQIWTTGVFR
jgi:hypothetical protein